MRIRLGVIALVFLNFAAAVFLLLVPRWHWPQPVAHTTQGSVLGPAQVSMLGPSLIQFAPTPQDLTAPNIAPPPQPAVPQTGPDAGAVYQNVQVLKGIKATEFIRLMVAMTNWIAPNEGCGFCHEGGNFASDKKPQKLVARVMLNMTRHINASWQIHVNSAGAGGVTCYTCHRGQPVPSDVYFPSPPHPQRPFIQKQNTWNESAVTTLGFFPRDSLAEYLVGESPVLSQSYTALPTGQATSYIVTQRVYEFMIQMSNGMGVNCGFCHNSRAFFDWSQSTPYRWTAYYGIRMARDLNRNFLIPADGLMPLERIIPGAPREPLVPAYDQGPHAGNALVVCGTCHHGAPLPLNGVNMVRDYPELLGPNESAGVPSPFPSSVNP